MRSLIAFILFSCLAIPALAQEPAAAVPSPLHPQLAVKPPVTPHQPARPIFWSVLGERSRLGSPRYQLQESSRSSRKQSWISRHPALFGALVGAGAGAVASGTVENELFCSGGDEDCFFHGGSRLLVGAGMGAGIGALVGWLGSR